MPSEPKNPFIDKTGSVFATIACIIVMGTALGGIIAVVMSVLMTIAGMNKGGHR